MNLRHLLAGTALTTGLLVAQAMPAAATPLPGTAGYTGPISLTFNNYEGFLNASGGLTSIPTVGGSNFGIFNVLQISAPGIGTTPFYVTGQNGELLVGVFNGIKITSVTGTAPNLNSYNTGGVFQLYSVPTTQFVAAGGDQGLAGYTVGGCTTVGGSCYNGITNQPGSQLVLTMDLIPGVDSSFPNATLTASVNESNTPPTGSALFDADITGANLIDVTGKDSFCSNAAVTGVNRCPGADGSTFELASQDPITATAVPEPGSLALLGTALVGLGGLLRRSKRKRKQVAVA